jgi:hypothetical protein
MMKEVAEENEFMLEVKKKIVLNGKNCQIPLFLLKNLKLDAPHFPCVRNF